MGLERTFKEFYDFKELLHDVLQLQIASKQLDQLFHRRTPWAHGPKSQTSALKEEGKEHLKGIRQEEKAPRGLSHLKTIGKMASKRQKPWKNHRKCQKMIGKMMKNIIKSGSQRVDSSGIACSAAE